MVVRTMIETITMWKKDDEDSGEANDIKDDGQIS